MTRYSTHADPAWPMSPTARIVAASWFEDAEIDVGEWSRPVGLLVGEQPRPGGNPKLPLWPWPKNCAGARLFAMSGMKLMDYLRLLARVNVSRQPVARWNANGARQRGLALIETLPPGMRVIACGARARDALGIGDWFRITDLKHRVQGVAIPHPSGRNLEYNDPDNRKLARAYVRWAARLR